MALDDLVSEQPAGVTPTSEENVLVENAGSDTQQVEEVSGEVGEAVATQQEATGEDTISIDVFQKRLGKEVGKRKELEEQIASYKDELAEIKSQIADTQPKTIRDYDSETLRNFIRQNSDNPDYEDLVAEARDVLPEVIADERINAEREKMTTEQEQQRIKFLESQLIKISAAGSDLSDGSELANLADEKYGVIQREFGIDNVKSNPLAPALAILLAKGELSSSGQSLKSRVLNRDNRIETPARQPVATDDSLSSYLKENTGPLRKSGIDGKGTLREAIKKLGAVQFNK